MSRQSEAQQEEQLLFFERAMKREEGEIGGWCLPTRFDELEIVWEDVLGFTRISALSDEMESRKRDLYVCFLVDFRSTQPT